MNIRVSRTAQLAVRLPFLGSAFLDAYDNKVWLDTTPTITTRIYTCQHYWIMEKQSIANKQVNTAALRTRSYAGKPQALEVGESNVANAITSVAKDSMIMEKQPSPRQQSIRARQLPNGNIRCYQDDNRKSSVSELQFTHPDNCAPTVTTQGSVKTIISPPHGYFKGAERSIVAPTCKASAMQEQHFVKEQSATPSNPQNPIPPENPVYPVSPENPVYPESPVYPVNPSPQIRIRRLTERELFRLMDVSEPDIDTLLAAGISKSQLAKLAGNSIVVNVLYHIFRTLFVDTTPPTDDGQLRLF